MRYAGPIDGDDIGALEQAVENAATWDGPIVVHVLTQKGHGYTPAEEDEIQCLHDVKAGRPTGSGIAGASNAAGRLVTAKAGGDLVVPAVSIPATTYTDVFSRTLIRLAEQRPEVVALTAAMPGPTGLLAFQSRFPDRFFDVGIAEQHEVTAAAGMAMGGLRPVVAVYSTFLTRATDQMNLDVGLHHLPVVFALDRAGITGENGASHHGVLDLVLALAVPGMTVFAPSSAEDLEQMLELALTLDGPSTIRFPTTGARHVAADRLGHGLASHPLRRGDGSVCLLGVGKMVQACEEAAELLAATGMDATVWDVRVVSPTDPAMITDAGQHRVVVTVEDGLRNGGAGTFLADAIAQAAVGAGRSAPPVTVLGTPRAYLPHGRPDEILADLGLDGPGVAGAVRRAKQAADQALLAP